MKTENAPIGIEALDLAIVKAGGIGRLAQELGLTYQAIQFWRKPGRRFATPAEYAPTLEKLTGVRCEDLRPDIDWAVLRGTTEKAH